MALENLNDVVEYHPRFTFDLTHSLLGHSLPEACLSGIVELHLSGTDGNSDHLPFDEDTLHRAKHYLHDDLLVCVEIFDLEDALRAVDRIRDLAG